MARVVVTGTLTTTFGGMGTGRSFRIEQAVTAHLRDGKAVEAWEVADLAGRRWGLTRPTPFPSCFHRAAGAVESRPTIPALSSRARDLNDQTPIGRRSLHCHTARLTSSSGSPVHRTASCAMASAAAKASA